MSRRHDRRVRHRRARALGSVTLTGTLLAASATPAALGANDLAAELDTVTSGLPAALARTPVPLLTTVTDRAGTPIATVYDQYRLPVTYEQIAPAMRQAAVSIEDKRFWQETGGLDPQGTLRAVIHNAQGGDGSVQGASTITQQYVKNFLINVTDRNNPAAQAADQADTLARKVRQAKMAVQVSRSLSKQDILAGYLNVVEFTGNIYGVAAAAQAYFGTTADKLTVPQAALLAGMVNNPVLYDPYQHPEHALERRNEVLAAMADTGALSPQAAAAAAATPLGVLPGGPALPGSTCMAARPDAGFLCQYALTYLQRAGISADEISTGGFTITTSLDSRVSQTVKDAVDANVPPTQDGVTNTLAVIQPGQAGHQVLAMAANRAYGIYAAAGETSSNVVAEPANVFGAGSSFKIFTSAAALEQGTAGLDTSLPNPQNACFPTGGGPCYHVQNDGKYPAQVSLAQGLSTSPNVAFVSLELRVGVPHVVTMAYRLGLRDTLHTNDAGSAPITDRSDPESGDPQYNQPQMSFFQDKPSFTLGDSPVSPLEMANVAATIRSNGVWCPPTPVLAVTDRTGQAVAIPQEPCEQVVTPAVATTLQAGLGQDTTVGTSAAAARNAAWHHPDIGKTGTTEESESVAFIGAVDGYAASSMVFASGNSPRELCPGPPVHLGSCGSGAFGGTVAAPPYFQAMQQLLAGQPNLPLPAADPAYRSAAGHGPIVPWVVGQPLATAQEALHQAGYGIIDVRTIASTAPQGQVVGQTPQGNQTTGTPITLYLSTPPSKPAS
jgi:membrane peptidoglycan carboxypeptidase